MKCLIVSVLLLLAVSDVYSDSDVAGVRRIAVSDLDNERDVQAMVWYPAGSTGVPESIGANAVFSGTAALPDAAVKAGRYPLILLSHGGFRSAPGSANWLASALARLGYIAAVVIPPDMASGPPSAEVLKELGLRPQDLSAAISTLTTHDIFQKSIDAERIAAVGLFLGGHSALALAGIRPDAAELASSCTRPYRSLDCEWFAGGGVDLQAADLDPALQTVRDQRIKAVVAVDPELTHAASSEGLDALSAAIHLVNVGPWADAGSMLNASELAARISGASYDTIPDAGRFSTFGDCTDKAVAILEEEGESTLLCQDGDANASRAMIHKSLAALVVKRLNETFTGDKQSR
ncbi:alpha/beta hydrolase family protein [Granulosicoccus sp. 3-233]|uniref:alpha/beta hydrolase family protein n=1 Tax=Granulosicoccus sp. 3-233 TaxID=3417969 RepID=UPI003D33CA57